MDCGCRIPLMSVDACKPMACYTILTHPQTPASGRGFAAARRVEMIKVDKD